VIAAIEARGLGRRYGHRHALRDCSVSLPHGRVTGLVGPNGAGKTTLLQLAAGLVAPTSGTIKVLGAPPATDAAQVARVGFVAQDAPLYASLTVADHLRLGAALNPRWDQDQAAEALGRLGLDPRQRAGTLSGGQRAQVALMLAITKRPELLILDEPVASLDPLARRGFLQALMAFAADSGATIVLSSHLVTDLERVCDYLVVMVDSHVRIAGDVDELLGSHYRMSGPRKDEPSGSSGPDIVQADRSARHSTLVVHSTVPVDRPGWDIETLCLEDIVLAHMARAVRPPAASEAETTGAAR
jgi:ABC-2 type transport system ATP-binding protein